MIDNIRHGQGLMIYNTGNVYQGLWENNQKNGFGILKDNKGVVIYEGTWKNDVYHGRGV